MENAAVKAFMRCAIDAYSVYDAGSHLGGIEGRHWHCRGCDGYTTTPGFSDEPPPRNFPHSADCLVQAAREKIRYLT